MYNLVLSHLQSCFLHLKDNLGKSDIMTLSQTKLVVNCSTYSNLCCKCHLVWSIHVADLIYEFISTFDLWFYLHLFSTDFYHSGSVWSYIVCFQERHSNARCCHMTCSRESWCLSSAQTPHPTEKDILQVQKLRVYHPNTTFMWWVLKSQNHVPFAWCKQGHAMMTVIYDSHEKNVQLSLFASIKLGSPCMSCFHHVENILQQVKILGLTPCVESIRLNLTARRLHSHCTVPTNGPLRKFCLASSQSYHAALMRCSFWATGGFVKHQMLFTKLQASTSHTSSNAW